MDVVKSNKSNKQNELPVGQESVSIVLPVGQEAVACVRGNQLAVRTKKKEEEAEQNQS